MLTGPLTLEAVGYDHPDARSLVAAVQRVYRERYGDEDVTAVDPAQFSPPEGLFLVGRLVGAAVACGGWRRAQADPVLGPGDAEIKRMYVSGPARGHGYSRVVLAELERTARASGARRMVLETGTRQPEAVGLYTSAGYHPIDTFGAYRGHPMSLCFAKDLDLA